LRSNRRRKMGILRIKNDFCIDDDRLVIWSFEGVSGPAYNGLVGYYDIKEVVINTGKNSVVPDFLFYGCQQIESVVIKDGVTIVGDYAFYGCTGLTSVTMPDSVMNIGDNAFRDCYSLMNVVIPDSVTNIGDLAFKYCNSLTRITIPDSVTSIGSHVFFGCSNLKNISIPAQLEIRPEGIVDSDCAITRRPKKEVNMTETNNTEKRKEVNLYNSKFVHFEWDEVLRGKKVFCGDYIETLQRAIHHKGPSEMGTLSHYSESDVYPFCLQGSAGYYRFAYYDPNYEVKWAYFKEDKPIQIRRSSTNEWGDLCPGIKMVTIKPEYFDDERFEFRVKPEETSEPKIEVNVDVKVNNTSSNNKVKIIINGKECIFENAEQARMVLKG